MAEREARVDSGNPDPEELAKLKQAVSLLEELGMQAAMIAVPGFIYSFTRYRGEFRILKQPVP